MHFLISVIKSYKYKEIEKKEEEDEESFHLLNKGSLDGTVEEKKSTQFLQGKDIS